MIDKYLVSLLANISEITYLKGSGIGKVVNKSIMWSIIMKIEMFVFLSYFKCSILILFPFLKYIHKNGRDIS